MRPIRLEMEAFGSYPGREVVDFTLLQPRGLFVVTGETGTGKTTIFDAMSYALFGEMPSKVASEIRSHHASAERATSAKFTFDIDDVRYVVERSPEYERPKERGSGTTKQAAKVSLVRIDAFGTTSLATRVTDVKKHLDELIGLSADQFQKVVLLPQGDFTAFLIAGSDDREKLLTKLFGGEIYESVIKELKQRADTLSTQVGEVTRKAAERLEHAIEQTRRVHDLLELEGPDDYSSLTSPEVGELLAGAEQPMADLDAAAKHAAAVAAASAHEAQALVEAAKRFVDAGGYRSRLSQLELDRPAIEEAERAATESAAARLLVIAADEVEAAKVALQRSIDDRDQALAGVLEVLATIGLEVDTHSAPAISDAITTEQARVSTQRAALAQLDHATTQHANAERQVAEAAAQVAALQAASDQLAQQLLELEHALEADVVVDVPALEAAFAVAAARIDQRAALDAAAERLEKAAKREAAARSTHDELLRRFVATQAPRLAAELVSGQPCAVCGSVEHPAPAEHPEGDPVDFGQVDDASKQLAKRAADREAAAGEVERCRAELGDGVDHSVAELDERRDVAQAQLDTAREAANRQAALLSDQAALSSRQAELALERAGIEGGLVASRAQLVTAAEALEAAAAGAVGIDAVEVARVDKALTQAAEWCAGLHAKFAAVGAAEALSLDRVSTLEGVLTASSFDDIDAARAALIDAADERRHLEAAQQHRTDTTSVSAALAVLEQQGIPDELPDTEQAQIDATESARERDRLAALQTAVSIAHRDGTSALAAHDDIVGGSAALIDQKNDAVRAYVVCRNGGSLHMPLQRWVLARELDRVAAAANVHLARMTAGRYSLRRVLEIQNKVKTFGLDLEVLDSNTGYPRSTTSLSGGEQFQASLALALGLADVVSLGGAGSGRRFEALFIDEGFGTLDDRALDQAIETLYQLHATGRMVGAITHVEGMKQRLHNGIVVKRLPDGGGSTLTVNP